jgi:hypothetical protein
MISGPEPFGTSTRSYETYLLLLRGMHFSVYFDYSYLLFTLFAFPFSNFVFVDKTRLIIHLFPLACACGY